MEETPTYTTFVGERRLITAPLPDMLSATKRLLDQGAPDTVLIFDDQRGRQVDFDFRGALDDLLAREVPQTPPRGRGRPRLGVVSREVSLLERHWSWLEAQPQGASATLRRLIDEARKQEPDRARARQAREAAGQFMTVMAGDRPGYEEASRALYAGDRERYTQLIRDWPEDVRIHALRLAGWGT